MATTRHTRRHNRCRNPSNMSAREGFAFASCKRELDRGDKELLRRMSRRGTRQALTVTTSLIRAER